MNNDTSVKPQTGGGIKKGEQEINLVKDMLRDYLYNSDGEYSNYYMKNKEGEAILQSFLDKATEILLEAYHDKYKNDDENKDKNKNEYKKPIALSTIKKYIAEIEAEENDKKNANSARRTTRREIKSLVKNDVTSVDIVECTYKKYTGTDKDKNNLFEPFTDYKVILNFEYLDYMYKEKLCEKLFYNFNDDEITYIENHYGAIVIHCTTFNKCKQLKKLLSPKS